MAVSVAVPDLGEEMVGGLVAEWYRPDGAAVQSGDPVCRIECAFVAFEVEAEKAGLLRHRRPAGSIERPGVVLGHILGPGEPLPSEDRPQRPASVEQPEQIAEAVQVVEQGSERGPKPEPAFEFSFEPEAEAEPLEEFEEALIEAVVVPFPRRFAMQPGIPLDEVPGDSVVFETSLFEAPEGESADSLPIPGGSIPGLALWEPEDQTATIPTPGQGKTAPLAQTAAETAAYAQILSMSVTLDCTEAERLCLVLAREWRSAGITPRLADLVFRAVALALRGTSGIDSAATLLIVGAAADHCSAIAQPASKSLLESLVARESGGDAGPESGTWQLVSLAEQGIAAATPQLPSGVHLALAVGAPDGEHRATLTAAYDSDKWTIGSMARLLARAREIFEAPYAMLV